MFFTSDCREVRKLLWELASGTVTHRDNQRAEAHLARCEACRSELDSYRNTILLMTEYKRDAVPASRLGWRDVERRVTSHESGAYSRVKQPMSLRQVAMGGGSLALATVFVMFILQANMNPPGVRKATRNGPSIAKTALMDKVSAPESVDFPVVAGILSITGMPSVDDGSIPQLRSARPHAEREFVVHSRSISSNRRGSSSQPQLASNEANAVNVDGGSPVQPLRPDYVLASASSGNDDDQNRRDVIDVVTASGSSSASDGSEESHPW